MNFNIFLIRAVFFVYSINAHAKGPDQSLFYIGIKPNIKRGNQKEIKKRLETTVKKVDNTFNALNCESSIGVSCTEEEKTALERLCNPDINRCIVSEDKSSTVTEKDKEKDNTIKVSDQLAQRFIDMGGDPIALTQALCFLNKNKDKRFRADGTKGYPMGMGITNQRYITINHLTKNSNQLRLFVIDLKEEGIKAYKSAHGQGTGKRKNRAISKYTSNDPESLLSPRGFFLTGRKYIPTGEDTQWDRAMRLHGLQIGVNDKSYYRGIVMHPVPYVIPNTLSYKELGSKSLKSLSAKEKQDILGWGWEQPSGRTQGCTGIGNNQIFEEIYSKIGAGKVRGMTQKYVDKDGKTIYAFPDNHSLYYNYSKVEKKKGEKYCGDDPKEELMLFNSTGRK